MKFKQVFVSLFAATLLMQTSTVPGTELEHPLQLSAAPLMVRLVQDQALTPDSRIEFQSVDPQGNLHPVKDMHGQGQWSLETFRGGQTFQIVPSPASYAGPLEVKIDGRIVSRYGQMIPSSSNLILEKVLTVRAIDGTALRVHYTDYSLEKNGDRTYPQRVLMHMQKAYESLSRDMKLVQAPEARAKVIEAYIGDTEAGALLPFGGFDLGDFRRAPLFMVRTDEQTGSKTPVLLLPANYRKFLEFWNRINGTPFSKTYTEDEYLATSVTHEMTHAVIHGFNENLGSTEHEAKGGDWYTEGLARYFECKSGSDAGFASEGFRKIVDGKVQFSRGGANYYLRYPDETFFSMRYENALFWMYIEKHFGPDAIIQISRDLKMPSRDASASAADYARILSDVTGQPFGDLLNDYFNWVHRGEYRGYAEGMKLLPIAATQSVWAAEKFYLYNTRGQLLFSGDTLKSDWIASWGTAAGSAISESVAGDWTPQADIQPLAFDSHQIMMSALPGRERTVRITNTGASNDLRVTLYLNFRDGKRVEVCDVAAGQTGRFVIRSEERITRIGAVLANLDPINTTTYQISIN
jgi:hypothetical protein